MSRNGQGQPPEELRDRHAEQARDPDELIQRRRIESILNARDRVRQARHEAVDFAAQQPGLTIDEAEDLFLKRAVDDYIRELEPLIREHDPELWTEEPIAEAVFDPPNPVDLVRKEWVKEHPARGNKQFSTYGREFGGDLSPRYLQLYGLGEYVNQPENVTITWEVTMDPHQGPEKSYTSHEQFTLPRRTSLDAYSLCNQFLNRRGMDLDFEYEQVDQQASEY